MYNDKNYQNLYCKSIRYEFCWNLCIVKWKLDVIFLNYHANIIATWNSLLVIIIIVVNIYHQPGWMENEKGLWYMHTCMHAWICKNAQNKKECMRRHAKILDEWKERH